MRFQIFSLLHISILAFTFITAVLSAYIARKLLTQSWKNAAGKIFGIILILNYIAYLIHRINSGFWEVRYDLPMELCNWAVFATIIALFTKKKLFAEISYFWVMTGSVNAVITPELNVGFPHPYFFIFFIEHSGVIIACCYAVFGLKLYPGKWSVLRVFVISQIYFAAAFLVNLSLKANYGFLMSKPVSGSLMDYMGEWPLYLLTLQFTGLILFIIVYIPFYFINRKNHEIFRK
jgi:hypothetical integral membrane protein (TIGR02206 family)